MCFLQIQDISVSDIRFGRDYSSLLFKMDINNYQPYIMGPSKCYITVGGTVKFSGKSVTKVFNVITVMRWVRLKFPEKRVKLKYLNDP